MLAFPARAFYSDVLIVGQFRGEGTGPGRSSTHESRGGGPPAISGRNDLKVEFRLGDARGLVAWESFRGA